MKSLLFASLARSGTVNNSFEMYEICLFFLLHCMNNNVFVVSHDLQILTGRLIYGQNNEENEE